MLPEGSSLSNWEKPGGKTGMVVLGLLGAGGLMLFYKALPFLITLASNTLYFGLLLGLIAGIIYLLCDPQVQENLLCYLLYVNEKVDWIGYRNRSYCYRGTTYP